MRQGFGVVDVWANVGYLVAFSWGNRFLSYLVRKNNSPRRAFLGPVPLCYSRCRAVLLHRS